MRCAIIALAPVFLAGCGVPAGGAPRFAGKDCAVRPIVEAGTGRAIVGAEDLALDPEGGRLFVSAQDRLAVARAMEAGEPVPEGGVYAVDPAALRLGPTRATAIVAPGAIRGGLRPQGIAFADGRLAVVNRRLGSDGAFDPVVMLLDAGAVPAGVLAVHRASGFCALNGVAIDGPVVLATLDRAACDRFAFSELLPWAKTGRLVRLTEETSGVVAEGFRFANGVVVLRDGRIAVAETRGGQIRLSDGAVLKTPGGPDNLKLAADGRIVAAVLPSLVRSLPYVAGWTERAPSRIVAVEPEGGTVELLFDDPTGDLFPGASVGILVGDMLVAGSVHAPGLLVCRKAT
jgi:sugar lactone lactonase YvrE